MSINALTLFLSLVYPMSYPYLSLRTLEALVLGYPFISFSNCGYKIKRLLGFVPMFFFLSGVTISLHSL
jgi:hypothetical protein